MLVRSSVDLGLTTISSNSIVFWAHIDAAVTWSLQWGGGWHNRGSERETEREQNGKRGEEAWTEKEEASDGRKAGRREATPCISDGFWEGAQLFFHPSLSLYLSVLDVPLRSWLKKGASCSCCVTLDQYPGAYSGADLSEFQWSWSKKKVLTQSWQCVLYTYVYVCFCQFLLMLLSVHSVCRCVQLCCCAMLLLDLDQLWLNL